MKQMNNTIYFYTGTGNSLWTAKNLARHLGNTEMIPMPLQKKSIIISNAERIGLIFPVHMWGLPLHVIDFFRQTYCRFLQNTILPWLLMPVRLPPP